MSKDRASRNRQTGQLDSFMKKDETKETKEAPKTPQVSPEELRGMEARIMAAIVQQTKDLRIDFATQFKAEIEGLKSELKEEIREIRERGQKEREEDREQLKKNNDDTFRLEYHQRKYNLVFKGLPAAARGEEEGTVKNFLDEHLKLKSKDWIFVNVHNLKVPEDKPERTPNIIARFLTFPERQQVLAAARKLPKGSPFSVQTDLPNKLQAKRIDLLKVAKGMKSEGKTARVVERGMDVILQTKIDEKWVKVK